MEWILRIAQSHDGSPGLISVDGVVSLEGSFLGPAGKVRWLAIGRTVSLRATHAGYAYQDLVAGVAFVDLLLGVATEIEVDTKGFKGDLFDDLTILYQSGARVRVQVKHTLVSCA